MRRIVPFVLAPVLAACAAAAPSTVVNLDAPPPASAPPVSAAPPPSASASSPPRSPSAPEPRGAIEVGEVEAAGLSDAPAITKALRPAFARCFAAALTRDPSLTGRVAVRMKVDAAGKVTAVKLEDEIGLDVELASCLVNAARAAAIPPPGGPATLSIPLRVPAK